MTENELMDTIGALAPIQVLNQPIPFMKVIIRIFLSFLKPAAFRSVNKSVARKGDYEKACWRLLRPAINAAAIPPSQKEIELEFLLKKGHVYENT
jgi:hypothetical protein